MKRHKVVALGIAVALSPGLAAGQPVRKPTVLLPVPTITAIEPTKGPAGTMVTISGTGFEAKSNLVLFGDPTGLHRPNGDPSHARAALPSSDGHTLRFEVPASGPVGILCDANHNCAGVTATPLSPGIYRIAVDNEGGRSAALFFTLTAK